MDACRRAVWRILLGLALCCGAAAFAAPPRLLLVTQHYPPYIIANGSAASGLVVDVVREVFSRMKQPVEIVAYPWSRALSMVTSGDADALFTIKRTPERERTLVYPHEPVLTQDYVFFARTKSNFRFDGDFAPIAKAHIGVVINTSYGPRFDQAVAQGQLTNIESAKDYEHIFRMLVAGRVDAVICSRLVGEDFLRGMNALDSVQVVGPPTDTANSYLVFASKNGSRALADGFDRAMAGMRKDGTLARIYDSYR